MIDQSNVCSAVADLRAKSTLFPEPVLAQPAPDPNAAPGAGRSAGPNTTRFWVAPSSRRERRSPARAWPLPSGNEDMELGPPIRAKAGGRDEVVAGVAYCGRHHGKSAWRIVDLDDPVDHGSRPAVLEGRVTLLLQRERLARAAARQALRADPRRRRRHWAVLSTFSGWAGRLERRDKPSARWRRSPLAVTPPS